MPALTENLLLKVVSEIHDPVTTTDELIPSGETSSYRSNPLKLASFALSRKDPAYVGRAQEVQAVETAREAAEDGDFSAAEGALPEAAAALKRAAEAFVGSSWANTGVGSTIFAVKPGDGSAREQAASCQKVLGGWANVAHEYATKRYRSNLINWGMLPLLIPEGELPFANGDYLFLPGIRSAVLAGESRVQALALRADGTEKEFSLDLGDLTDDEREIIADGCLINYYRTHSV